MSIQTGLFGLILQAGMADAPSNHPGTHGNPDPEAIQHFGPRSTAKGGLFRHSPAHRVDVPCCMVTAWTGDRNVQMRPGVGGATLMRSPSTFANFGAAAVALLIALASSPAQSESSPVVVEFENPLASPQPLQGYLS